jgi:hypothetical protein
MDDTEVLEADRHLLPEGPWRKFEGAVKYCASEPWALFSVTLLLQMPAVAARWIMGYIVFFIVGIDVPGGYSQAALALAVAPLIWAALAFQFPGKGLLWRWVIGAEEPSPSQAKKIATVLGSLPSGGPVTIKSWAIYVLDYPAFFAFSYGRTTVVSRLVIETDLLKPVLSHERWHVATMDGRVSQALQRLVLFGDPFPPQEKERNAQVAWGKRWFFRIAGGRTLLNLLPLRAAWAAYFRMSEDAADASSAAAGQALGLVGALKRFELPRELPNPRPFSNLFFNLREYAPVQHRIDRLRKLAFEDYRGEWPVPNPYGWLWMLGVVLMMMVILVVLSNTSPLFFFL